MKKNNKSWNRGALVLLLAGSAAGCTAEPVDIGDDTPPAVLGASLSDYQGTWVGYAELAEWNDGTDTVRLVLDENGNGVIEVGDAAPLPEPDPEAGFPPGLPVQPMAGVELPTGVFPGFSYPIEGAVVESKRIRMGTSHYELFREWCSLIEPVANPDIGTGYGCLSSWPSSDGTTCTLQGTDEPIDCGLAGCLRICNCDAAGCAIPSDGGDDIRMDAALESEGEELEGSFDTPQGRFQVRMTRQD